MSGERFDVVNAEVWYSKKIYLLIDDVFTTGSTVNEVTRVC